MAPATTFQNGWFLLEENTWRRGNLLSYRDVGILTIGDHHLEFVGRRHRISITSIQEELKFGTQGRDFINNWVHVRSEDRTVYFADGGWWGYRGHLADGTRKILRAILAAFPEPVEAVAAK